MYDLKYDHSRRLDLIGYWENLKREQVDPAAVYWQMMKCYSSIDIDEFEQQSSTSSEVLERLRANGYCDDVPYWMPKFEELTEMSKFARAVRQFLAETGQFEGSKLLLEFAHRMLDKKVLFKHR